MTEHTKTAPAISTVSKMLSRHQILIMAIATGIAVGSQYYNQPLLGVIANDMDAPSGIVATTTQIGYALGLILLIPLGDKIERRMLILLQCLGLAVAMVLASLSPSLGSLALASILIGVFATIAQQMIPHAVELASPIQRERALATITTGLLVGVLLARTASGFVGDWFGWRSVFMMGASLAVMMLACLALFLPRSQPQENLSYIQLLLSLFLLVRKHPALRRASAIQSLLFFGFSAFWTILALLLQTPRYGMSSSVAGMFGLVALAGAVLAPLWLRIFRRLGPIHTIRSGVIMVVASFLLMIPFSSLIGLCIGVVLMTTGLQVSLISQQALVLNAAGSARGRFNTVFMASQFAAGAAGSAAAGIVWLRGGWTAVMILASIASLLAIYLSLVKKNTH
ncbi:MULTISPECIES: MFS transporter [Enterobacterales]|uniref:MFS transporter n=1 Tax=Salmonella enteritidis TaxID=149539 RepID=A0A5V0B991_SALEN|nr:MULTISPECIES: MFS transporter [Enterobacterales]EBS5459103.1 MFS transporter [Salmonella enterica subsp. enterica serovar Enteritidis]ECA1251830.1 MFS transporter [Salmonella enterica subsp. enterica serovar Chailey]ECA1855460.1 MFS transporter [Salmonella enterica subsp. enterica serovar Chailey]